MAGTSESTKKSAATRKKKDKDAFKKMGAKGGAHTKRGYLGLLKDQGRTEELKKITQMGAKESHAAKAKRREQAKGDESRT